MQFKYLFITIFIMSIVYVFIKQLSLQQRQEIHNNFLLISRLLLGLSILILLYFGWQRIQHQ